MLTLYDLGKEVKRIQELARSLTVSGYDSSLNVVVIVEKCNDLILQINNVTAQLMNPPDRQNGGEEGELNGEPNSGTTP